MNHCQTPPEPLLLVLCPVALHVQTVLQLYTNGPFAAEAHTVYQQCNRFKFQLHSTTLSRACFGAHFTMYQWTVLILPHVDVT